MDNIKRIDDILVGLFNTVLKMEETALKETGETDLSVKEIHTLASLDVRKSKTMSEAAADLRISMGTLTVSINKLVKKGYVERLRTERDRRIVRIKLTDKGQEAIRAHEEFHEQMIGKAVSALSDKEMERFIISLEGINKFLELQESPPLREEEFKLSSLGIGDRIISKNLFQGAMSPGISGSNLVSAVVSLGGVGTIPSHAIGAGEKDYADNPTEADKRVLAREIKKAQSKISKNSGGMIAVNVMCSDPGYKDYVRVALDEGVRMIVAGAGVPTGLPEICPDDTLLIPIVSSLRAIKIILKNWDKKSGRVPDAFIFEGPSAGGILGYKSDQIGKAQGEFFSTIKNIKEFLEGNDIPLIVAGGIFEKQDADKVYAYGADAIQLGSRFVTTKECSAHSAYKKAFVMCGEEDTALIEMEDGFLGRVIRNEFVSRRAASKNPDYDMPLAAVRAAGGDIKNGIIFAGRNARKVKRIDTVADVFDEFR